MADRSLKTRQKMTFRLAPAKPRNPFVAIAAKRVAGPHRRSQGGRRVAEREALQRTLRKKDEDD